MNYRVRQHTINGFGQKVTRVKQLTGELSTGTLDNRGVEIFLNDKVLVRDGRASMTCTVKFFDGAFFLDDHPLFMYESDALEVVGYAGA